MLYSAFRQYNVGTAEVAGKGCCAAMHRYKVLAIGIYQELIFKYTTPRTYLGLSFESMALLVDVDRCGRVEPFEIPHAGRAFRFATNRPIAADRHDREAGLQS